jgi:hypothetical protein
LFDDEALLETLAVQGTTVDSARALGGGRPVVVGPIMLMPPVGGATGEDPGFGEGIDPRQRSLFCAAWTLGSLKQFALAGADAVTYFEAFGPRGLIEADARWVQDGARSDRAAPYPVHQLLVEVSRMSGGEVHRTESSQPLRADAVACSDGGRLRLLVANLRPDAQEVIVEGLPPGVATIRAIKASADVRTAESTGGLTFVSRRATTPRTLRLTLGGYEFAGVAVPDRRQATIRQPGRGDRRSNHGRCQT